MNPRRGVPELVYNKLASLGKAGLRWLAVLDDLIHSLEQEWGFVQSVTAALLLAKAGQMEEGSKMLRVAEARLE